MGLIGKKQLLKRERMKGIIYSPGQKGHLARPEKKILREKGRSLER